MEIMIDVSPGRRPSFPHHSWPGDWQGRLRAFEDAQFVEEVWPTPPAIWAGCLRPT